MQIGQYVYDLLDGVIKAGKLNDIEYKKLYFKPIPMEIEHMKNGEFKQSDEHFSPEFWYQYRRIFIRQYLRDIYELVKS